MPVNGWFVDFKVVKKGFDTLYFWIILPDSQSTILPILSEQKIFISVAGLLDLPLIYLESNKNSSFAMLYFFSINKTSSSKLFSVLTCWTVWTGIKK